jgi:hypothetical protein
MKQIDMDERRKIARWRMAGISVDHMTAKLGRHLASWMTSPSDTVQKSECGGLTSPSA